MPTVRKVPASLLPHSLGLLLTLSHPQLQPRTCPVRAPEPGIPTAECPSIFTARLSDPHIVHEVKVGCLRSNYPQALFFVDSAKLAWRYLDFTSAKPPPIEGKFYLRSFQLSHKDNSFTSFHLFLLFSVHFEVMFCLVYGGNLERLEFSDTFCHLPKILPSQLKLQLIGKTVIYHTFSS